MFTSIHDDTVSGDTPALADLSAADPEVAERLGYEDSAGRRAVEHFMQDYFRHATEVGELTRIFLTTLEAKHVKRAASPFTMKGNASCQE